MTEEEKKELKKLSQDELIELLDGVREDAEKQRAADKKAIMEKFLHGGRASEDEAGDDDGGDDVFNLEKNKAFQRLKKKF